MTKRSSATACVSITHEAAMQRAREAGRTALRDPEALRGALSTMALDWINTNFPNAVEMSDKEFAKLIDAAENEFLNSAITAANLMVQPDHSSLHNVTATDVSGGKSDLDVAELAASLCDAAEKLGDATAVATMLADALWVLLPAVPIDASPAARLAAEACIRVGQRAARDFNEAHKKFILEAERYGNDQ